MSFYPFNDHDVNDDDHCSDVLFGSVNIAVDEDENYDGVVFYIVDDDDDNVVLFGSVNIAAESSFYANDPCGLGVCLPDGASNVFFNAKYQMKPQMSFLMQNIPRICAIHVKVTTRYSLLTSMTTYYLIKNLGSDLVTLSLSVFSCD